MDIDQLLAPNSEEAPCGEDLAATGALFELETLVQGKPETQFSAAEEPNWGEVKEKCLELLQQSKDLRVAVILTATLIRTSGFTGLRDGMKLIRGYTEQHWDRFFPLLDPDDNNDPQERLNILNNLAAPVGTGGDPLKVIAALRAAPVANSREAGRFGVGPIRDAREEVVAPAGQPPTPAMSLIDGALRSTPREELEALKAAAEEIVACVEAIDAQCNNICGSTPTLAPLLSEVKYALDIVTPVLAPVEAGTAGGASDGPGGATGSGAGAFSLAGEIRNREQVQQALGAIIRYYQQHEPSSPAPFLLKRVSRLVNLNFIELIKELTPDAMDRILTLTGPLDDQPSS